MRWLAETPPQLKSGDTRVRRVFAWKRTRVGRHIVWLEFYEVYETYFSPAGGGPGWWSEANRRTVDFYC